MSKTSNLINSFNPTVNIANTIFKELKNYYNTKDDKYIFQLYFRVTNSCNFRCNYCFFNHELDKKRSFLDLKKAKITIKTFNKSLENFKKDIKKIHEKNKRKIHLEVHLTGGELTVLPEAFLEKLLNEISKLDHLEEIILLSNGSKPDKLYFIFEKIQKINSKLNKNIYTEFYLTYHSEQLDSDIFLNNIKKLEKNIKRSKKDHNYKILFNIFPETLNEKEIQKFKNFEMEYNKNTIELFYTGIDHVQYQKFFNKNKILRKCYNFTYFLDIKNDMYLTSVNTCNPKKYLIVKPINFLNDIYICDKACSCFGSDWNLTKDFFKINDKNIKDYSHEEFRKLF
jgi:organic radical activating enzyme